MQKPVFIWILSVTFLLPGKALAVDGCPPSAYTVRQLLQLKQAGFVIEDDGERNRLALGLIACLADPDPKIRDGVAYEALAHWLRKDRLTLETRTALYRRLTSQVAGDNDSDGFRQPFAALVLAEVARTDRIQAWMTDTMRAALVNTAASYLAGVRDYRGFNDNEGWRHGVAHGSDLVLQLVLNPKVDAAEVRRLMAAVAPQIAPGGPVFYVFGEPARLARAVYYAYRRDVLTDAEWAAWFTSVSDPKPLPDWGAAYASRSGLAKRHNTRAFLLALYFDAKTDGNDETTALAQMAGDAVNRISSG